MSWDAYDEGDQTPKDDEARLQRVQRRLAQNERQQGLLDGLPVRVTALVTIVAAALFIAWLIFGIPGHGKSKSSISHPGSGAGGTAPVALSYGGLKTLVSSLKQPVYWIGTKPRSTYEFRQLSNGNIYLRYLPAGTPAGSANTFLTVGTYAMSNAFGVVQGLAKNGDSIAVPGNAVAFSPSSNATDAYIAFSGVDYQIEVYSPTPGLARRLVARGIVTSVPGGAVAPVGVSATTAAGLRQLATTLGQPIYWASTKGGTTLEVRQTSQGYIYVRYLPKGVAVGDPGAYRSVATYPLANAFSVTRALGQKAGNTIVNLPGGGIGVYAAQGSNTNAYVAFPNVDFQIEVFDPTPGRARTLVTAGKIVAVR